MNLSALALKGIKQIELMPALIFSSHPCGEALSMSPSWPQLCFGSWWFQTLPGLGGRRTGSGQPEN